MSDRPVLRGTLATNPNIGRWLRFDTARRTVTVLAGRVEIGQGVLTAFAQIVAEELDIALERVRIASASTAASPDEGYTASSASIDQGGGSLRQACAEARALLLGAAAERLGIASEHLSVEDGRIGGFDRIRELTYWDLPCANLLNRDATGFAHPKAPSSYRVVGRPAPRLDLPSKVAGAAVYVHDLTLPDMLHARVVRPPAYEARLTSLDADVLKDVPGVVSAVHDGRFLGIVAEREEQAVQARRVLSAAARWELPRAATATTDIHAFLREHADAPSVSLETSCHATADGCRRFVASYTKPYIAHASIGPSCAVARWDAERSRLEVWSHTQGVFPLRSALSGVLGIPAQCITVTHLDGAGCYGHNGADDAALDAALLARTVAPRPVKLQWMRDDEFRWEPFGPAMAVDLAAELDADGTILRWEADIFSQPHNGRPGRMTEDGTSGLVAAWHLERPYKRPRLADSPLARGGGSDRNAGPLYAFPNIRVSKHLVHEHPLRVSTLRALGAYANVFAIESFMDELATAAGRDPVAFRLSHLHDARARAVVELAARRSGWTEAPPPPGRGLGIAFAQYKNRYGYLAIVCEVDAERDLRVLRVTCAADVGQTINPDGVKNQIEGGVVQALSWTLKERVAYDGQEITSLDWAGYPIIGFAEIPEIEVHLIDRPDEPPLGAGEISCGPTAAAVANAVYRALGVRIRDLPITRERIVASLRE